MVGMVERIMGLVGQEVQEALMGLVQFCSVSLGVMGVEGPRTTHLVIPKCLLGAVLVVVLVYLQLSQRKLLAPLVQLELLTPGQVGPHHLRLLQAIHRGVAEGVSVLTSSS